MKRVIGIDSSRRRLNTKAFMMSLEPILKTHGIELEYINLHDYRIDYCHGCETCISQDFCPIEDDVDTLNQKLIAADGIVLTSPVYMENIAGILKTYIDRNCKWFHRSALLRKPFLALSTTKGSGLGLTLGYLQRVADRWGMIPCGKIGRTIRTINDPLTTRETVTFVETVKNGTQSRRWVTPSQFIYFNVQKASNSIKAIDRRFWEKTGLKKANYYYPALTDPLSYIMGKLLYRLLYNKMHQK